ncbi:UDP-glucuronosyl/UDP-glucosyltransferase [Moelleriella libera RCEF 2490]|uniref:UDP-glucuronosyl/UDP-glucosyltransferase n=1 Tax=Moelleriella libera RCEF 2490 TaxID=1081109 RepID=A0A167Y3T1_9HYPO|nr:UDP-glucuronosyl/UDP-glucosyltransferase [Moelleriella libera RCEF 2490]
MTVSENPALASNGHVDKTKLQVLVCASPWSGHTMPMINIAEQLVWRGYSVTFIAGTEFRKDVDGIGARFVECPDSNYLAIKKLAEAIPTLEEQQAFFRTKLFIEPTGARRDITYQTLEDLKRENPWHSIVIVTESLWLGHHPLYLGAPLPKGFTRRPRIVNIHAIPYHVTSRDTAPFIMAIMPDDSEESREMYRLEHEKAIKGRWAEEIALQMRILAELGCTDVQPTPLYDLVSLTADVTLQMCPPSLEYKRSDFHPRVRFTGALGPRLLKNKKAFVPPAFWDDVVRGDRKVVVVTQGTVAVDYSQLVIPAIKALAQRSDIVVVAILGVKGASLPADVTAPNAHVADYLSYDAILPHASVFVMNAGYGGFVHGAMNGVPMVLAGASEEKPEVANRGEYAGIGINLRTATPTEKQVADAVDTLLRDSRYKKRVMAIKKENEDMRAMDNVERAILEMATADDI